MTRTRVAFFGSVLLMLVLAGTAFGFSHIWLPALSSKKAITPLAPPNPLSIEAIRQHPLTTGNIQVVQTLAPRGGCTTQIVSFTSDGLTEYGLATTPTTPKPAAGYPVVVLAHGYIEPAKYQTAGSDYQNFINTYCAAGYLVLKPDYRGNGTSQGAPGSGQFSPEYTYDVLNLIASLKTLPAADANRVGLIGHSLGGAVALRAAVASHNLPIKAYIFVAGVVGSWQDILEKWPDNQLPPDLVPVRKAILAQFGTPESNPTFWHDGSSINYVDAIGAPVQVHVGSADEVVPPLFSTHLDQALTAANKPHDFYVYQQGNHQFSRPDQRASYLQRSVAFLNTNLRAK